MEKPNTYIRLYFSNLSQLEMLSFEQVGRLIVGIMAFKYNDVPLNFEGDKTLEIVAQGILGRINEDFTSYGRTCEINRHNGAKGGAPKGNQNAKKKTTETTERLNSTIINKENNKENNKDILSVTTESGKPEKIDYQWAVNSFNTICTRLPRVIKLTDSRKKKLKNAVKLLGDISLNDFFKIVNSSDYLNGDNDRNWHADFDWILNTSNLVKIIEGNYDNREKATATKDDIFKGYNEL